MRYYRRRFRRHEAEPTVRRYDGGREVCLANEAGRAEYMRRKQLLWEDQAGQCAQCHLRMWLLETRMTGGSWGPTGQQRDDRLRTDDGRVVNRLVHKVCLGDWHRAHEQEELARAGAAANELTADPGDLASLGLDDGFDDDDSGYDSTAAGQREWIN
jgi:hypothetical protein